MGSNELLKLGLLQLANHLQALNSMEHCLLTKFTLLNVFSTQSFERKIIGNSLILRFSKCLKFLEILISLNLILMFRNSLCTSYNLIVWKNFFFAFLELKFVSGRFVHCFAGKGAVILSLYCCFYYYNYSYHHHHHNYDNYHCYYHYYHYYYHRHYYYHFFFLCK